MNDQADERVCELCNAPVHNDYDYYCESCKQKRAAEQPRQATSYQEFLKSKAIRFVSKGFTVDPSEVHPKLFTFQRDSVLWALRKGRALIGLQTGLGKTVVASEYARLLIQHGEAKRALIIAPLSVARQTVRICKDIVDTEVHYTRSGDDLIDSINITNYEMVDKFNPSDFGVVILDEASLLKSIEGHYRRLLTKKFAGVSYRLCCTATPAPNDDAEIGMYCEYLGVNTHNEMLSMFFINANKVVERAMETQDGRSVVMRQKQGNRKGQEWRLRVYGKQHFYEWLASWALMMTTPSDLGYEDDGYVLPPLNIYPTFIDVDYRPEGQLFFTGLKGIQDRTKVRRSTMSEKLEVASQLCNDSNEQWIVWCGLAQESTALKDAIKDSVEVKGSDTPEYKTEMFEAFQDGKYKVLISKVKIAGFGLNFQQAHNMAWFGMDDSFEKWYQANRRMWRFGQKHPVNVYPILTEVERQIWENVTRKEKMALQMQRELIKNIEIFEREELSIAKEVQDTGYNPQVPMTIPEWLKGEQE